MNTLALRDLILRKERSCEEVARETLETIQKQDERIGAFLHFNVGNVKQAIARARALDERIGRGENPGPLAGVPVAVKDNISTRGIPTTCASRMLEGYRPTYDAHVVEELHRAGAVVIGKTNLDEFAMGSSTENSALGLTRNPHDLERVPGGSSGGSAAAVAAGMVRLALGSDTGGSIRQPASFCGVVGLKPTYGLVSRYGLVAFGSSLDQIGPLASTVEEAALLLNVIATPDPRDSTCRPGARPDHLLEIQKPIRGLRVGIPKEYFPDDLDEEVSRSVRQAAERLKELGAINQEISLPHTPYTIPTYCLINTCEASSNLARYDGVHYGLRREADTVNGMMSRSRQAGFGPEVKRRIILGTFALSSGYYEAYYQRAQKVRTLIQRDFTRAFEKVDVILGPTAPSGAFRLGALSDPLQMYLQDLFTVGPSLAGLPALSIPCGKTSEGLPIGLQWIGKSYDETTILRAAHQIERSANSLS
jgi:aspartyl-tRNA(Asn)/glutamyl-tRNA(Gln) amidotransferase subunit A